MSALPEIGSRWTLTSPVERFPFFVAEEGRSGVVIEVSEREIGLQMDEPIPGCEEWENTVYWVDGDCYEQQGFVAAFRAEARLEALR